MTDRTYTVTATPASTPRMELTDHDITADWTDGPVTRKELAAMLTGEWGATDLEWDEPDELHATIDGDRFRFELSPAPLDVQATDQLVDVMAHWCDAIARLDPDARLPHETALANRAAVIVAGLVDPDDRIRAEALISLIPWLGPESMPVSDDWWTSPLGLLASAAQQQDSDEWVTQQQAADAIGVSRRTMLRMVDAGDVASREGGPTGGRMVSRRDAARVALERSQA